MSSVVEQVQESASHSDGERALIDAHVPGHEAAALGAATVALDATYRLLDGIERVRSAM